MTEPTVKLYQGDCLDVMKTLEAASVQCCVTSPPYWGLRQYLPDGVRLKADAPPEVLAELESLDIKPVDRTSD